MRVDGVARAPWTGTTVLSGDLADQVRGLKAQARGNMSVLGSPGLVQTLMAHDLVNEYALAIHPIVLGSGKKLFRDASRARPLELVTSTTPTTGVLLTTYRPVRRS